MNSSSIIGSSSVVVFVVVYGGSGRRLNTSTNIDSFGNDGGCKNINIFVREDNVECV